MLCFQSFGQILQILASIKAHPVIAVNIIGAAFYSQSTLDSPYFFPMLIKSPVVFFKQFGRIGELLAVAPAFVVEIEICQKDFIEFIYHF